MEDRHETTLKGVKCEIIAYPDAPDPESLKFDGVSEGSPLGREDLRRTWWLDNGGYPWIVDLDKDSDAMAFIEKHEAAGEKLTLKYV